MTCPHCQAPLVADARFCPACGKATAPTETGTSWPVAQGSAPDLVGREIAGRYRILKKLGEGGMGAVYRGEQMSLKRAVAVKVLRPEVSHNQLILQRFNAEAQVVAKLSHPNTVNIYDFGQDADGALFIAMEYIEGHSLREAIQREAPFSLHRALTIALQVAASLSDAHAHGIVHRDLKPDNVMLQERGRQKDVVRVLDFGIAKLRDDSRATQQAMTQAGDMLGTPQYMAPEQIRGDAIDGRTDIYALGGMIYEMVTGRLPHEATSVMAILSKHLLEPVVPPSQRRPELALPPVVDHIIAVSMAKEASARPPTMDAFAELLGQVLAQLPPDPNANRSGGLSMQQGVAGHLPTPAAPSSFGAPFPPPMTPPPMAPPMTPPPMAPPMTPIPKTAQVPAYVPPATVEAPRPASRAPLYAVLGLIALGGTGAAVYFATRPAAKPAAPVAAPTPATDDPWASRPGTPSTPSIAPETTDIPTTAMPIPAGASLTPPEGFTIVQHDRDGIMYKNAATNEVVAMAPLDPGSNDPPTIAAEYAKQVGAELLSSDTVDSLGAQRPMFVFKQTVNGVQIAHVGVLYTSPKWRVGVLYVAPEAIATSEGFEARLLEFYRSGVHLP